MENEKTTIHNLLILDESGSMHAIYNEALSGANETIQTIRSAQATYPDQDHRFTFVTFNTAGTPLLNGLPTGSIRTVLDDVPAGDVRDLTCDDYHPSSCTPLYDAMGVSITALERRFKEGDRALVTVITDGLENASREYSRTAIKAMVDRLREKGWTFVYIGANQDAIEVAKELSIRNSIMFESNPSGTKRMFNRVDVSRRKYYEKMSVSKMAGEQILYDEDFFGGEDQDKKD